MPFPTTIEASPTIAGFHGGTAAGPFEIGGVLWTVGIDSATGELWIYKSTDGGENWNTIATTAVAFYLPFACFGVGVDGATLIVTYSDAATNLITALLFDTTTESETLEVSAIASGGFATSVVVASVVYTVFGGGLGATFVELDLGTMIWTDTELNTVPELANASLATAAGLLATGDGLIHLVTFVHPNESASGFPELWHAALDSGVWQPEDQIYQGSNPLYLVPADSFTANTDGNTIAVGCTQYVDSSLATAPGVLAVAVSAITPTWTVDSFQPAPVGTNDHLNAFLFGFEGGAVFIIAAMADASVTNPYTDVTFVTYDFDGGTFINPVELFNVASSAAATFNTALSELSSLFGFQFNGTLYFWTGSSPVPGSGIAPVILPSMGGYVNGGFVAPVVTLPDVGKQCCNGRLERCPRFDCCGQQMQVSKGIIWR